MKCTKIVIRLPEETYKKLVVMAKKEGLSVSQMVVKILEWYIAEDRIR